MFRKKNHRTLKEFFCWNTLKHRCIRAHWNETTGFLSERKFCLIHPACPPPLCRFSSSQPPAASDTWSGTFFIFRTLAGEKKIRERQSDFVKKELRPWVFETPCPWQSDRHVLCSLSDESAGQGFAYFERNAIWRPNTSPHVMTFCARSSSISIHLILSILSTLPIGIMCPLLFHLCLPLLSCASAPLSITPLFSSCPSPPSHQSFCFIFPPSPSPLLPPSHPSSSGCPCTRLPTLLRSLIVPVSEHNSLHCFPMPDASLAHVSRSSSTHSSLLSSLRFLLTLLPQFSLFSNPPG